MARQSDRRLAENEVIFREANRDVDDFLHDVGASEQTKVQFYCECSHPECTVRLELTLHEYEAVHKNEKQFIVAPGHELLRIERIVQAGESYFIVEKKGDLPEE